MNHDPLVREYIQQHPDDNASTFLTLRQKVRYLMIITGVSGAILFYDWHYTLLILNLVVILIYFTAIAFRCAASFFSLSGYGEYHISDSEARAIPDAELPVYTILLPLYREEAVADKIVGAIRSFEYPLEKLDIKLLLEEDDTQTRNVIGQLNLPEQFDIIIVPDGQPKTKPKACNYGLRRAKGEFCVIYDAEDRPDPLQLRKVVAAFRQAPENLACIQAKLNYFNATQNQLTRWFTVEYSTTFDLFLPGLQIMGVPIPLGGTSNHFRTEVLQKLGGWDPFNVTEDCDLGIKIYKAGYLTRMIDSTTYEEANSRLWNWIRQRSRWTKGFLQTHLTHTRSPFTTLRQLGVWGYLGFLLCVGFSSAMMLLNVIYWILAGLYGSLLAWGVWHGDRLWDLIAQHPQRSLNLHSIVTIHGYHLRAWPLIYYGPDQSPFWSNISIAFFAIACFLFLANLLFVTIHILACLHRKRYDLLGSALTMPIYWILISIGAWKGFIQLFTNPFYWEKTVHGLDQLAHSH
ncbi:MAG: glycosyltransferase [Lentisphaerae bacterium]|nr:MAG: glycosyltransferase [Lentisphaerota bacterium]